MAFLMASLRQLRTERTAALALGTLVLATALLFSIAPRVLDVVADRALRDEVSAAEPVERSIALVAERRVRPDPRTAMAAVATLGERYEALLPASVRTLVTDRDHQAETSRWKVVSEAAEEHFTTLRFQPGVDARLELTAGRLPTGVTRTLPYWADGEGGSGPFDVTVVEVALAVPSATELGVRLGDVIRLQADPSDRLNRTVRAVPLPSNRLALEVVGLYRVTDPGDAWWLDDAGLAAPVLRAVTSEVQFWDVVALAAPDAYATYLGVTEEQELPLRYAWRYHVDPARLDAEQADGLVGDLRRLESIWAPGTADGEDAVALRSGLSRVVEAQRGGWHSVEAVLAVVAVGPAAVALTALALVILLVQRRRRAALVLQRGRGASTTQIAAAAAFEGLLIVGPAVALAVAIAAWLVPAAPLVPTVVAAGAVGAVVVALLVGLTVPASRFGPSGRAATVPGRRSGTRRLVFEALVVALAVVGAVLLRSRGVQGGSSTGALVGPDPLIAAVPALLGLAAALVALRVYPLAMRAVAAVAGRRSDLVPALALRQAARGGTGGPILLVLLATIALGVFSSATLVHLDGAADAVAWQETGAAFRLDPSGSVATLPSSLDTAALPGVEAVAEAGILPATYATRGIRVPMMAVDVPAFGQVAAGTPMAPRWPAELTSGADGTGGSGGEGDALPAIVSSDLATGTDGLAVDDELEVTFEGRVVRLRVAEVRRTFPGMPAGSPFIVTSRDQLEQGHVGFTVPVTTVFLRARSDEAGAIRDALADRYPGVDLQGRDERAAELRASPVVAAVTVGVAVAAIAALAYAGLAVAASLALAGAARAGETAMLRTLGLTGRQSFGLVVAEHGPTVLVAVLAGAALGVGLFAVLRPGLGLGTVVGSPLDIPLSVDPIQLLLLLAAVVAVVGVSIALAGALQRAVEPADALRRGLE